MAHKLIWPGLFIIVMALFVVGAQRMVRRTCIRTGFRTMQKKMAWALSTFAILFFRRVEKQILISDRVHLNAAGNRPVASEIFKAIVAAYAK